MAPSDEEQNGRRKICTDSFDNPFIAFQRFIDEQMSQALQSLIGLPSGFTNPQNWPRDETPDRLRDEWRKEDEDRKATIRPMATGEEVVSKFLTDSPYSPYNIERDSDLKIFGPLWRQAFGDLMDATEGKRMTSSVRNLNSGEWMAHYLPQWGQMVEQRLRGQHPLTSLFGDFGSPADAFEELRALRHAFADQARAMASGRDDFGDRNEEDKETLTELDMYERMLNLGNEGSCESRNQHVAPAPPSSTDYERSEPARATQTSSLISTLTTTERITMPDGSVRTKKVLKKRFADGSEESNESEELQAPQNSRRKDFLENAWNRQASKEEQQDRPKSNEKKKGGWFWS